MLLTHTHRHRRFKLFLLGLSVLILGCCGYMILAKYGPNGGHQESTYSDLSLKSLGQFVFDDKSGVDSDIPTQYRVLDGKKVSLEGFMFTPSSAGGEGSITQLVWGFGDGHGPPQVQDRVFLHPSPGHPVARYDSSVFVTVRGTLHVKVMKDSEGGVYSVYDLTVVDVTPETGNFRAK
jgi:hypothetical protein